MIFPWFRKRNPARDLAKLGVEKRRALVIETAQRIRDEMGLPADGRLASPPRLEVLRHPRRSSRRGASRSIAIAGDA